MNPPFPITPINSKVPINSSINIPPTEFAGNSNPQDGLPKYGYMLEVDETYLDNRVRWNPRDNKLYGICYDHGRYMNLEVPLFS